MIKTVSKIFPLIAAFYSLTCLNPFAPSWDNEAGQQICPSLTETEGMFCNFKNAYSFKDTTIYGSLLSQNFTFIYRDYDRGIDVSWGREDEMRATFGLFQSAQSLSIIWNNIVSESGDSLRKTVVRGFNLNITFNPSDITRVDGYANLTFEREDFKSNWKILRWRDESNF
jgi:hypothetical protein